ncbi:MAG: hypothetical protein EON47_18735 [Acetobacteraceae bacterium]|nr:MAG: hypothetical protein EON47_18735 [Acetobacteraceae bacterium]
MAFVKPIEISNTGLVAAYWRLTYQQTDHDARIVEFRLCGYADREAREAGKVPLPSIALWNSDTDVLTIVRRFDYTDFRDRLS